MKPRCLHEIKRPTEVLAVQRTGEVLTIKAFGTKVSAGCFVPKRSYLLAVALALKITLDDIENENFF